MVTALKKFRQANDLNQTELGDYLGISKQYVSYIEKGSGELPDRFLAKLLRNDEGWDTSMLVDGSNDATRQTSEATAVLRIPLVPTDALAGSIAPFHSDGVIASQCEQITSPIANASCAIRITGESMAPRYSNGSIAVLKLVNDPSVIEWGRTYVLDTIDGAVIKELHHNNDDSLVTCVSLNPDPKYHPYNMPKANILNIYRVLMVMSFE